MVVALSERKFAASSANLKLHSAGRILPKYHTREPAMDPTQERGRSAESRIIKPLGGYLRYHFEISAYSNHDIGKFDPARIFNWSNFAELADGVPGQWVSDARTPLPRDIYFGGMKGFIQGCFVFISLDNLGTF